MGWGGSSFERLHARVGGGPCHSSREVSGFEGSGREREKERDQKKPRLLGAVAPKLPEFGGSTQHARKGGEEENRVEHFDLTGDDDLMGEGGGRTGPAPTVPDNDAAPVPGDELSAPYTAPAAGADAPPWVHSLLQSIELMHRKQDSAGKSMRLLTQDVDTAKGRIDTLEEVTQYHNVAHKAAIARMLSVNSRLSGQGQLERLSQVRGAALLLPLFEETGIGPPWAPGRLETLRRSFRSLWEAGRMLEEPRPRKRRTKF